MPLRPDRLAASSDPDDRPEPSLSRSRDGRMGEASPRATIMAGPGRDTAPSGSGLELRAGERMSVVSLDSDERASDRGLFVKAAGGAIILLAIVGAITLLHGFAGL
jgi:hypothetical protein